MNNFIEKGRAILAYLPDDLRLFELLKDLPQDDIFLTEAYSIARREKLPTEAVSKVSTMIRRLKREHKETSQ